MPTDKSLVTASNGFPAQNYNSTTGQYEEAHGSDNAAHQKITDPTTGVPIDPRNIVVTSLETRLDSIKQIINDQQTLTKKVEVTNQKVTQTVNGTVGVNNYPSDYPDAASLTELQAMKSNQVLMVDELKRISGSFGAEDLWGTPGNQKLVEGDKDAGFFGFVTAADFINGDDLAAAIGLSAGVSQFSDAPWIKYMWKGKVCFTPLKTIRSSIDWDSIYNVGAVYGSVDEGTLPAGGRLGTELTLDAADNSINTTGHFLGDKSSATDYYDSVGAVGDTFVLDGWVNAGNNGEFLIDSITDSKIVVSGGVLVSEVGDRASGMYPKANVVTQNAKTSIKGFDFNVRLFRGVSNDPLNSYVDTDRGAVGDMNEWNSIILPLHERAESQNWNYPNYAGTTENWRIYLSDEDLMTHTDFSNGSYSWCQETRDDTQTFRRVSRGNLGASYLDAGLPWRTNGYLGWRPVIELSLPAAL